MSRFKQIANNLEKKIAEKQEEIESLKHELHAIMSEEQKFKQGLIATCPSCKGTGQERYTDAAGSGDWRDCLTCKGRGHVGSVKCECGGVITIDMTYLRRKTLPKCPFCGKYLNL